MSQKAKTIIEPKMVMPTASVRLSWSSGLWLIVVRARVGVGVGPGVYVETLLLEATGEAGM